MTRQPDRHADPDQAADGRPTSPYSDFDRYGRSSDSARREPWPRARLEDLGTARVERIRGGRTGRPDLEATEHAVGRSAAEPAAPAVRRSSGTSSVEPKTLIGDSAETESQRVGGKRRIRGEIVAIPIGVLFLIGALMKPWAGPAVASGSPTASAALAAPASRPFEIAQASSSSYAYPVAPWNYRGPNPDPTGSPNPQTSALAPLSQGWAVVDWSALGAPDAHADWGFSAVQMPDLTAAAQPAVSAPQVSWTEAPGLAFPVTVSVPGNLRVFALALTWPTQQRITAIKFQYLGGPEHPPYLPPAGFPPFTAVSPLPAGPLVTPPPGTVGSVPAATPTVHPAPSARTSAALRSGEFWVPPAAASWLASTAVSISDAWRQLPWAWPMGSYRVTIVTAGGSTEVILKLQQV